MQRLEREEGRKKYPYADTKGKITIGVGWNLSDNGLPDEIIDELLGISMTQAERGAETIPGYFAADPIRQSVVVAMCFQMGTATVLNMPRFCAHFAASAYDGAADEMLNSKWHKIDSPARAEREAKIMRTGILP